MPECQYPFTGYYQCLYTLSMDMKQQNVINQATHRRAMERAHTMLRLYQAGHTVVALAEIYGVTRQRIYFLLQMAQQDAALRAK